MKNLTALFLFFSFLVSVQAQNIINVNNTSSGVTTQYTTLAAAVAGAVNGDIIYIYPSPTSYGNATIDKQLTIIGPGYNVQSNPSLQINTYVNNAILGDITYASGSDNGIITGSDINYLVLNGQTNIQIKRNKIRNRIYLSNTNNILVEGCYFENGTSTGDPNDANYFHLSANTNNNSLIVKNNIFFASYSYTKLVGNVSTSYFDNIYVGTTSNGIVENNVFHDFASFYNCIIRNNIFLSSGNSYRNTGGGYTYTYTVSTPIFLNGSSNLFENNVLIANQLGLDPSNIINQAESSICEGWPSQGSRTFDDRFMLKAGSPAIGAGYSGEDCGAFEGFTTYKLSGIPFIPLLYQVNAPASGTASSGINVNVKVRSNN